MAYEITKNISHNGSDVEVYYVGQGTGVDTIWSDLQEDRMKISKKETADDLASELGGNVTVRKV
mgnify:CR=1 FL=1